MIVVASALGVGDYYRWTADVARIPDARPYDGLLSNVGIVVWSVGATVPLFTAFLCRPHQLPLRTRYLLVAGGLVTAVLLADDLFMVHDTLMPEFFGVPEILSTAVLAGIPLAFLWSVRTTLPQTPWVYLVLAVGYLGVMTVVDVVEKVISIPGHHLWEEGPKLLGILLWCGYFVATSLAVVRSAFTWRTPEDAPDQSPLAR